jgi:hypothetical protein
MTDLYKMFFPNWDEIKKVRGWPEVGDRFWKFICNRFQDFDRMYHPDFNVYCGKAIWPHNEKGLASGS